MVKIHECFTMIGQCGGRLFDIMRRDLPLHFPYIFYVVQSNPSCKGNQIPAYFASVAEPSGASTGPLYRLYGQMPMLSSHFGLCSFIVQEK
jgi:hypothetical protein